MCNLSYAYQRADLVSVLSGAEPKDRVRALEDFDHWVNGPLEGWDDADRRVWQAINEAA